MREQYEKILNRGSEKVIEEIMEEIKKVTPNIERLLNEISGIEERIKSQREKLDEKLQKYKNLSVNNPNNLRKIDLIESNFKLELKGRLGEKLVETQSESIILSNQVNTDLKNALEKLAIMPECLSVHNDVYTSSEL